MRRGGCLRGGFAGLPDGCQAAAGMKHIVNFDAGALRAACMAASQHTPRRCGNGGSDAPAALCVRGVRDIACVGCEASSRPALSAQSRSWAAGRCGR